MKTTHILSILLLATSLAGCASPGLRNRDEYGPACLSPDAPIILPSLTQEELAILAQHQHQQPYLPPTPTKK